jgi:hypothetical protein
MDIREFCSYFVLMSIETLGEAYRPELAGPCTLRAGHDRKPRAVAEMRLHSRSRHADTCLGKGAALPSRQAGQPAYVPTVWQPRRERYFRTATYSDPRRSSMTHT